MLLKWAHGELGSVKDLTLTAGGSWILRAWSCRSLRIRLVAKRSLEGGPRKEGRREERREGWREGRERRGGNTGETQLEFGDSQIDSSTYCSSLAFNLV